jgi:hypothetical protein
MEPMLSKIPTISVRPQQKKEPQDQSFVSKLKRPSKLLFTTVCISPRAVPQRTAPARETRKSTTVLKAREEAILIGEDQKLEIQEEAPESPKKEVTDLETNKEPD